MNVSAQVMVPTAPDGRKWGPLTIRGSDMGAGAPSICTSKSSISVTMTGKPTTAAFYERIRTSEQEHVTDLKSASNRFLVPLHAEIMALRGSGADEAGCRADLQARLAQVPDTKISSFLTQLLADIARRDTPGGHPTRSATHVKENCDRIEIISEHKPAPGGTP